MVDNLDAQRKFLLRHTCRKTESFNIGSDDTAYIHATDGALSLACLTMDSSPCFGKFGHAESELWSSDDTMPLGTIVSIVLVVAMAFLGWRNWPKTALAVVAAVVMFRLAMWSSFATALEENRRLLGIAPVVPSLSAYILQAVTVTVLWSGIGYGAGLAFRWMTKSRGVDGGGA